MFSYIWKQKEDNYKYINLLACNNNLSILQPLDFITHMTSKQKKNIAKTPDEPGFEPSFANPSPCKNHSVAGEEKSTHSSNKKRGKKSHCNHTP